MKKIGRYVPFFCLFFFPLLFYPAMHTSNWRSSGDVHAMLEFSSSLLAVTAGIMILLHFFTSGRRFFLIISIGFVLICAEEFVHSLFSYSKISGEITPPIKLAISATWLTGNLILAVSFFIAVLFGDVKIAFHKRTKYSAVYMIIGFICALILSFLVFHSSFLPLFVQIGSITKKSIELSLAFLFLAVFGLFAHVYAKDQSRSPLLWSIVAFIIIRVLVHIFVFDAQTFYDSHWDSAHLLVLLSYFLPIFGIWGETIRLNRSSQLHLVELEKEMSERKQTEKNLTQINDLLTTFILMDDEEVIRETVSGMLESFGYNVLNSEDGREAVDKLTLEITAQKAITALILDLTIPGGMGGKEAIGEIRKISPTIPVFVASGYADDPVMANPREFGFVASICKPFKKSDLAELLNKHLVKSK
jgi:CheY-like chemotaxis protein